MNPNEFELLNLYEGKLDKSKKFHKYLLCSGNIMSPFFSVHSKFLCHFKKTHIRVVYVKRTKMPLNFIQIASSCDYGAQ